MRRFLLAVLLVTCSCASAQPAPSETALESATAAMQSARDAFLSGDLQGAAELYRAAFEFKRLPAAAFAAAQTERRLGHAGAAARWYRIAISTAETELLLADDRRAQRSMGRAQVEGPSALQEMIDISKMHLAQIESASKRPDAAAAVQRLVSILDFRVRKRSLGAASDSSAKKEPPQEVTPESSYLTDVVRSALAEAGVLVITRDNIVLLLRSHDRAPSDCIDLCEVETGRLVGADLVVSGELLPVEDGLRLSIRLHDSERGQFIVGIQAAGHSVSELERELTTALPALVSRVKGWSPVRS